MPGVSRTEFEDFRRESTEDRRELHREVRDAAQEIRELRGDLRLIAKLGGGLVTLLGILAPITVALIQLFGSHK